METSTPHAEAVDWAADVGRARRATRAARRTIWFTLALLGAVVLGAAPLYRASNPTGGLTFRNIGPVTGYLGGDFLSDGGKGAALYWLISLPLAYVAIAAFMRWRARRTGVSGRVAPYVITGLALFGLLVLTSPGIIGRLGAPASVVTALRLGDMGIRGLTPLLPIAVGLLVLAWLERSAALAVFSAAFLGLALTANLYDVGTFFGWVGLGAEDPAAGVIVPGAVLLLGGLGFGLAALRDR